MLEFGEVPIGLSRSLTVTLVNTSEAPFTIDSVEGSSAFSIRAPNGLLEGLVVSGGGRLDLDVSFVSIAETEWSEPLVVHTREIDIPLQLHSKGVFRMIPEFTVDPAVIDFGSVEVGSTTRLTVALKNVGNAKGTLISATPESGGPDFALTEPWPLIVTPDVIGVFPVSFTPTHVGSFSDHMLVGVSELDTPVAIELKGIAGGDGQFFCNPSAVTFGAVERGRTLSQMITCTARGGQIQITGSELAMDTQFFALTSSPPPNAVVAADQSVTYAIDFRPDGLPVTHNASLQIHYSGAAGAATLNLPISGEVGVPRPRPTPSR